MPLSEHMKEIIRMMERAKRGELSEPPDPGSRPIIGKDGHVKRWIEPDGTVVFMIVCGPKERAQRLLDKHFGINCEEL